MTSIPASRSARAITFAPRSCPSSPGLATSTRILRPVVVVMGYSLIARDCAARGAPPAPPAPAAPPPSAQPAVAAAPLASYLPEPKTPAAAGVNPSIIQDLLLKTLYYTSYLSGHDLAALIRLPFYGILDQSLIALKR